MSPWQGSSASTAEEYASAIHGSSLIRDSVSDGIRAVIQDRILHECNHDIIVRHDACHLYAAGIPFWSYNQRYEGSHIFSYGLLQSLWLSAAIRRPNAFSVSDTRMTVASAGRYKPYTSLVPPPRELFLR